MVEFPTDISLVTLVHKVSTGSLENDKALLRLCEAVIEQINVHSATIRMQQERIDMLETRHEALLTAFYSHCQEVADEKDEPRTH